MPLEKLNLLCIVDLIDFPLTFPWTKFTILHIKASIRRQTFKMTFSRVVIRLGMWQLTSWRILDPLLQYNAYYIIHIHTQSASLIKHWLEWHWMSVLTFWIWLVRIWWMFSCRMISLDLCNRSVVYMFRGLDCYL